MTEKQDSKKKSALKRYTKEINGWIKKNKDLAEAKMRAVEIVAETKINDYTKAQMNLNIEDCEDLTGLVTYLYNSLLKREGFGVK